MILLELSELDAEAVIAALLSKISYMETTKLILKSEIKELTERLRCSENPNSSESEAGNNG